MKKIVLVLLGLMLIVYPLCAVEPMIAAGSNFSVALGSDGIIYAWGTNRFGQLGDGSTQRTNDPIEVDTSGALSGKTITAIAAGYHHTVALDLDGKLYAWGSNDHDKLGGGFADFHVSPIEVKTYGDLNGKIITAIAAGYHHTVALDSDGKLYAWGNNDYGQLGDGGHGDDRDVPTEVNTSGVLSGKTITAIAAGYAHTVALDSDGKLYAWGGNEYGQLGDNSTTQSLVPVQVDTSGVLSGKTITAIAAGYVHTVALDSDGKLYAWGDNYHGKLGVGDSSTINSNVPVEVDASGVLSGKTITAIAAVAGSSHTLALDSDGKVYGWGDNHYGQLGDGSSGYLNFSYVPVTVVTSGVLSGKTITAIAAGGDHTLALDSDMKVYAWGNDSQGQLGNGFDSDSEVPVEVRGLQSVGDLILPISDVPTEFALEANYPNPFNPTTSINYQLLTDSKVELSVFDMNGKKITTLVNEAKSTGYYSVTWDASNVSSGIYFYRLQAGDFIDTKKMVYMK